MAIANRDETRTGVHFSHTPATDGTECRWSYGRWYRQYEHITPVLRDTLHWLPCSHCQDTFQDWCFDLRLCPMYWSCLPQARVQKDWLTDWLIEVICLVSDLSRRSLRSAGRGDLLVSRANTAKFLHRGSCRLERTSTWSPFTDSSDLSWKPIFSDKPIWHYMIPLRVLLKSVG